jgi:transposase
VTDTSESLPTDLAAAHAMILAERAARVEAEALAAKAQAAAVSAEAAAANARADLSSTEALISHYRLEIEKLRRQLYGTRSERTARVLEQMELQLEELEATATRMNWRPSRWRRARRPSSRSSASGPHANHSPNICRASAS